MLAVIKANLVNNVLLAEDRGSDIPDALKKPSSSFCPSLSSTPLPLWLEREGDRRVGRLIQHSLTHIIDLIDEEIHKLESQVGSN